MVMSVPKYVLVSLLASTILWSAGAANSAPASSVTSPVRAGEAAPQLTDSHPCPDISGFTCSTLRVPLDHSGHEDGHLDLQVATADNTDAPRGTLLVLTGGPGQPGVAFVNRLRVVLAPVLDEYRLVMLDQRGTGANALVCPQLQEQLGASDLFVPTPDAVRECATIVGEDRRFYSTADTVADLDLLRRALGVDAWVIDGISYGTYVAERYAIRNPHAVSRLVLDSVVPHDGVEPFVTAPMRATGRVLRDVCAARLCPGDPAEDLATVIGMRDDGSDILNAITIWEFVSSDYIFIPEILHAAAQGDMAELDSLIAAIREGVQASPSELSQGLHASTLCGDGDWPWGSAAAKLAGREDDLARAATKLDPSEVWPFDIETAVGNGILQTCLLWPPTKVANPPHRQQLPDVPTLLLGGERDLSTPIEWLRQEANVAPGAEVVIVSDATHSVQTRATDDSARRAVDEFLTAQRLVPPRGL